MKAPVLMVDNAPAAAAVDEAFSNNGCLNANLPLIYAELRQMAVDCLKSERPDHTLQATELVHEAYLRLIGQREVDWENRGHALGVAGQMMRRILANHARSKHCEKRGGFAPRLALDEALEHCEAQGVDASELSEALGILEKIDPRQALIVELRFYAGLTVEEAGRALSISPATVKREWTMARLWLRRELGNDGL